MEKAKYDVFISYSRKDLELVKEIKAEIDSLVGIDCWMDLDGIESGEQFEDVIINAICKCDTILFMMSANSMQSEWALDELDFAMHEKKRIVLVSIDNAEMSGKFYFSYHKYNTITWNNQPQREKLIRDLKSWIGTVQKEQKTLDIETEVVWASNDLGFVQDKNSGKYGIIRKNGEIVEPCQWTAIKNIGYKVYAFKTAKKEWIIYNLLKEQSVSGPWKDLVKLEGGVIGVKGGNDRWGLITDQGKQISQCIWKAFRIATLKPSFALVQDTNGKWGMISNSGELLSKCLWRDIRNFYEGLAPVQNENENWGYINTNGDNVIPCIWEKAYRFSYDRACVQNSNGKYGFIDKEGHLVIPCKWQYVSGYFGSVLDFDIKYREHVVAVFGKRFLVGSPDWYVIDKQGKIIDTVDTTPHEDNQLFGSKGIKVFKPIPPDQGL